MKKGRIFVNCAVTVLAAGMLLPLSAFAAANGAEQYIGEEKAKAAALENAGLRGDQVTFIKTRLDYEDGLVVYDVEFVGGDSEYDYEIDAASGEVLEFDREIEYYPVSAKTAADTAAYIGEAEAKAAALNHAGLTEAQVSRLKVKLDRDDGLTAYEVEFDSGRMEYEYEIDATSGAILEADAEYDD